MTVGGITLIIFSGLGVVHGIFLAISLWFFRHGSHTSNRLLSLLLLVLSFRVGKSVFLEFTNDLDIKIIFSGLASMLAIGPLFYLYTLSAIDKSFALKKKHLIHFAPLLPALTFGILINDNWAENLPTSIFVALFTTYYGHYLAYLVMTYTRILKIKNQGDQTATYRLLRLLLIALMAVWLAYVLNLFDDFIPYVVGPILYTSVAYVMSFVIIQKGYVKMIHNTKYKTTPVSDAQVRDIFAKALALIKGQKQFRDSGLTLKSMSHTLGVSPQVLSLAINKESHTNFNQFINQHRIDESIRLFQDEKYSHYTIAAIAYEVGFNSISSFNTAFKQQTGKKPLQYRNELIK